MVPDSMAQYWLAVFIKGIRDSLDFVKEDKQGIAFGILILVLTGLWLAKKHGWRDAMKHWWRTAGEAVVIAVIAWFLVFIVHLMWEPFHLQDDLAKNRQTLQGFYDQRGNEFGLCKSDLSTQRASVELLKQRIDSQQQTINVQQATFNTCVVTLAKNAALEPLHVGVWTVGLGIVKTPIVTEIVLLTNRTTVVRGDLQCDGPFNIFDWTLASGGARMNVAARPKSQNDWYLQTTSPLWEPQIPVVVNVTSKDNLQGCKFTPTT
ncbi:MAG TPA: hypothetical protein VN976_14450 [Verrucomicrobiae bacterium]|nr:hypothetical protein [Verrucomicrobiae bacterium]